ncbi:acyl-CoA N-acyltransferase [Achaetomium macrosporum]|uniref:Acyl-CoA N-acyltransferase n=1 Tax=Achaetomium macrosporum TaxID=79813 RepID=A0AAN7C907_9PEZI|nr:acyl-CoA N-acyltransferase [Achaetomium macrosporum]
MTTPSTTTTTTTNNPNPLLHFRVATPADTALLHTLVQSAFRGDESRLGWTTEANLLAGDRISPAGLLAKITHPEGAVLLASTSTTITSTACCEVVRRTAETAYFGMFAVSPRRQGGGIGKAVLAYAEEYCRRVLGVERMELSVIWSRGELIAWYMRRGYRRTGEEVPFPHGELARAGGVALKEDLHMVIMAKDLCYLP